MVVWLSQDFQKSQITKSIQGFDVVYQLYRLRHAKNMPNVEVEAIMRSISDSLRTYDQVVEVGFSTQTRYGAFTHYI